MLKCMRCSREEWMAEGSLTPGNYEREDGLLCPGCLSRLAFCKTCPTLVSRLSPFADRRFPSLHEATIQGCCEGCKATYYLKHRDALQACYQAWLAQQPKI